VLEHRKPPAIMKGIRQPNVGHHDCRARRLVIEWAAQL
jgi:hypothetical protein